MDLLKQLTLHVEALSTAMEADQKFFASIIHYVRRMMAILTTSMHEISQPELEILANKIEEFYRKWRPTAGIGLYVPPRQTSDTDSTVQEINKIIVTLSKIPEEQFNKIVPSPPYDQDIGRAPEREECCVFIGHGRSKLWARVKIFLEDEIGLPTITYESEPRTGESIVPILEKI